jgi:DNA mismatch repair protein MutL
VNERRTIALLPPAVVERVAAGEAIERPAAAVKELLENALDAGATDIVVEASGGGLTLLRVADDGDGIPADELELACRRHATSKLAETTDLEQIATLGFRGEALASLVAIADLTLLSATPASESGWQVNFAGGERVHSAPVPRRPGTTVVIRRLFNALPGRRRFLESPSAENSRIAQLVRRYGVTHPHVRFSLQIDARLLLRTTGSGQVDVAAAECWGPTLRRGLLRLPAEAQSGFSLEGWIGDRTVTRATRSGITLAVNGRPVEVVAVREALEAAYRPLLPRGRHPFAVLMLSCEPADVDVNVHPTKAEVLLRRREEIAGAITRAVRGALAAVPAQPDTVAWTPGLRQGSLPAFGSGPASNRLRERRLPYQTPQDRLAQGRRVIAELPQMRLLGQVQGSLILVEGSAGLYLVDQHRAHERLLYERLCAAGAPQPAQALVEPIVLEVRREQAERFAGRLADMATLGFRIERLQGLTYLVHTVPTVEGAASALVAPASDDDLWREATLPGDHWLDRLRTSVACRTALRRGQALQPPVMRELLHSLAGLVAPTVCPHGSPLILEVTSEFLARQFDWG